MPYCRVVNNSSKAVDGEVNIFYQLYGYGDIKVLLIPGLASTHELWTPQLLALAGTRIPNEALEAMGTEAGDDHEQRMSGNGVQVCALDNRGVGKSSKPEKKFAYSTEIMAMDALSVLDHLGWQQVHVCGHSMGGMIASKLVAMAPQRVLSACFLAVTGGGYQCLPKLDRAMISLCFRFLRANTPEKRARVDLETHYTQDYLDEMVDNNVERRLVLLQEYVTNITATGMQPAHGFDGQAHACWTHALSEGEIETVRRAGLPVLVIHGRGDVIAQVRYGRHFAKKLHPVARLIELPGGHMLTHQHTEEVNEALLGLLGSTKSGVQDWSSSSADVVEQGWPTRQRGGIAAGLVNEEGAGLAAFLASKLWISRPSAVELKVGPTWWQLTVLLFLAAAVAVAGGWVEAVGRMWSQLSLWTVQQAG